MRVPRSHHIYNGKECLVIYLCWIARTASIIVTFLTSKKTSVVKFSINTLSTDITSMTTTIILNLKKMFLWAVELLFIIEDG